ncbi:hypothetical protein LEN26_009751 [Aphanomyces euteiches]|nr:hypothetical protein AeMF1_012089 [Aphanomyces euteiches]KAH9124274.1 hypothetical protein LEN26_009751 [Aphanomyces euteiches]KAH9184427.1 hypothetical protein AeNC1_013599 [Aphanomyces euteiches]
MAVLPPTYLAAVVILFVLFRLRHILSLSALLLKDVAFFLPPDSTMLDSLNTPVAKKAKYQKPEKTVGERLQLMQLSMSPIGGSTLTKCLFFDLYDTLVVVTVASILVFWIMQFMPAAMPDPSYYLLLGAFVLSLLFPFLIQYGISSYETQLGIGVALLATILAMFTLYDPFHVLDFNVEGSAASMDHRWQLLITAMGLPSGTSSLTTLWLSLLLGGLAGMISSTTLLPAFRFSRMYSDFVASKAISTSWKVVLHLNVLMPLVLSWAWFRPLSSSLFVGSNAVACSESTYFSWFAPRDCGDVRFLTESTWRNIRLNLLVVAAIVRLACYRDHVQYFLLEPKHKVTRQLLVKGRVDTQAIVDTILIPFTYVPVICVQYLTPVCLWLVSAFLLQRKADRCFSWFDFLVRVVGINSIPSSQLCSVSTLPTTPSFSFESGGTLGWNEFTVLLQGLQSFPLAEPLWFESVLGFLVWWSATSWFVLSTVGLVYHNKLDRLQQPWTKQKTN